MRRALFLVLGALGVLQAEAQMQWWPTEVRTSSGVWLAEGDMRDAVDGTAFGGYAAWMTRASNGWAAFFGGVEHGGFVGMHRIGASSYGWQPQLGWTLRTGQTRLVGWSFSTGLAYNTKIYDPETSPDLEAVGSHFNGLVRLGVTVANDSPLSLGVGILHTSNGALRRPNKGINTPQAQLTFRLGETPRRSVYMDGAQTLKFRSNVGLALAAATTGGTVGTSTAFRNFWPKPRSFGVPVTPSLRKGRWCTTAPCAPIPRRTHRPTPSRPSCLTDFSPGCVWVGRGCLGALGWTFSKAESCSTPRQDLSKDSTRPSCSCRSIRIWTCLRRSVSRTGAPIT